MVRWVILGGLSGVLIVTLYLHFDLKRDIARVEKQVNGEIRRLEQKIDHHLDWHKSAGRDPTNVNASNVIASE